MEEDSVLGYLIKIHVCDNPVVLCPTASHNKDL